MVRRDLWLTGILTLTTSCGGGFSSDLFGGSTGSQGGSSGRSGSGGARGTASSTVSVGVGGVSTSGSGATGGSGSATSSSSAGGAGGSLVGAGGAMGQGGSPGTGGNAGTGTNGGAGLRDAGSSDAFSRDAGDRCSALQADVTQKLSAAQACGLDAGAGTCQTLVEGLCCHVPVASKDSEATVDYLDALNTFRQNRCPVACPAIPCPFGTTSCKPSANGSTASFSCQY